MSFYTPVPAFEGEDHDALKDTFARLWARYPACTPMEIGMQVFAGLYEPHRGLQAGAVWSRDLDILTKRDEYARSGEDEEDELDPEELRVEIVKKLLAIGDNLTLETKDRINALLGAAKVAGIGGEGEKGNINVQVNNRVIEIPYLPPDEWESFAIKQQEGLLIEAKAQTN